MKGEKKARNSQERRYSGHQVKLLFLFQAEGCLIPRLQKTTFRHSAGRTRKKTKQSGFFNFPDSTNPAEARP
jgi:hypothetical protein